jgi:hypothetical protein
MLRTTFVGSFLVVEGSTDARVFKRFIDETRCIIIVAHNRDKVVGVVSILDAGRFEGHVGAIDRDFADLLGENISSENISVWAGNDMETSIFLTDVFDRVIAEYASDGKVTAFENEKSCQLRSALVSVASDVGTLRYLSRRNKCDLNFDGMTFQYKERGDIEIDIDKLIEHLRGRSQGTVMPSLEEVKKAIIKARAENPDALVRTCGHDICELISKGVHDVFGRAHHHLNRGAAAVEEIFRAAYTWENFQASTMYAQLRAWEGKQNSFWILKAA